MIPLLSSSDADNSSSSTKKAIRKLRRRHPPPSLSNNHQKLPSSAGSSRPTSSRSTQSSGWLSSTKKLQLGGNVRRSLDNGAPARIDWSPDEFRRPPEFGLGAQHGRSGTLTPPEAVSPPVYRDSPSSKHVRYTSGPPPGSPPTGYFNFKTVRSVTRQIDKAVRPAIATSNQTSPRESYNSSNTSYIAQTTGQAQSPPGEKPRRIVTPGPHAPKKSRPKSRDSSAMSPVSVSKTNHAEDEPPVLPSLPSFSAGGFGLGPSSSSSSQDSIQKSPITATYPGRKHYSRRTSKSASSVNSQDTPRATPRVEDESRDSPDTIRAAKQYAVSNGHVEADENFHAITTEEPILLSSSTDTSQDTSPIRTEFPLHSQLHTQPAFDDLRKKEEKGSFLGGWKLAMRKNFTGDGSRRFSMGEAEAPVGVGPGGGWIQRRRGSFSSPRPPSAEKAKHNSFAQEYKEFRASKASASSSNSSKRSSVENKGVASGRNGTLSTRAAENTRTKDDGAKPPKISITSSGSTRQSFRAKIKSIEARQKHRNDSPEEATSVAKQVPDSDLVSLDVAVKQMSQLEEQLKSGRPLSPPDSRDGVDSSTTVAPLKIKDKGKSRAAPIASEPVPIQQPTKLSSSTDALSVKRNSLQPAPPPGHKSHRKDKSMSPLRHEMGTSPSPVMEKSKINRDPSSSSHHSANSAMPPPSEYLGKQRTSLSTVGTSRPPTPPKPIAKLFVICCRCKYWHDLPSVMYRGMVENGGATRCPYCLHGMETSCCSGYTCVVYLHQRHH